MYCFLQGSIIPILIHYSFVRSIFTLQNLSNSVLGTYFEIGLLLALLSKDSKLCKILTSKWKKLLGNLKTHSFTFVKMCLILRTLLAYYFFLALVLVVNSRAKVVTSEIHQDNFEVSFWTIIGLWANTKQRCVTQVVDCS
jgi:hypothetical protein